MDVTMLSRLVDADQIGVQASQQFVADLGIATEVDCGSPVVVIDGGAPVTCLATDARGAVHELVIDVDADGALRISLG